MKCILHIGTEKTGSTSIQHWLEDNRELLFKQDNIYFSHAFNCFSHRHITLHALSEARLKQSLSSRGMGTYEQLTKVQSKTAEQFQQEVSALPDDTTVVISSEFLVMDVFSVEEISRLKAFLTPFFDEFEVIVYLRRQDQFRASLYPTLLKSGFVNPPMFPEKEGIKHRTDYRLLLEMWSFVFGSTSITPRIFSRSELTQGDVVEDLYTLICSNGSFNRYKGSDADFNTSINDVGSFAFNAFNTRFPRIKDDIFQAQNAALRGLFIQFIEERASGKMSINIERARAYFEQFAESNRYVARQYFNQEQLFDDDFSRYKDAKNIDASLLFDSMALICEFFDDYLANSAILNSEAIRTLPPKSADMLRGLAVLFEETDIKQAEKIMQLAHEKRPKGTFIKQKLDSYRQH